jgi:hypothetical protein
MAASYEAVLAGQLPSTPATCSDRAPATTTVPLRAPAETHIAHLSPAAMPRLATISARGR